MRLKLEGVCLHHDQGSLGAVACPQAIRRQIALLKDMGANAIRTAHNPASVGFIDSCNQMGMLVIEEAFDTWIKNKNGNRHDYGSHFAEKINMDNRILGKRTDETWAEFDLRAMIRRDYNAPSVIAWSLGNEVMEGSYGSFKSYPLVLEKLLNYGRMLDPFRAFTMGENKLKEDWEEAVYMADTLSDAQGWIGFNYADGDVLDRYHQKFPHWCIYGAETASALSSRAPYPTLGIDQKTRQITAYDKQTVAWGHQAAESWFCAITRDYVAGEFVWTGFDYLGEPTPWNGVGPGPVSHWPAPKSSYFGIIDTAGNPKDRFYFYQSQWRKDICVLHIVPAWHENILCIQNSNCAEKSNAVDFHEVEIIVYSNAASVELFITDYATQNTISLGKKTFSKRGGKDFAYQIYQAEDASDLAYENLYLRWLVPYKKGRLFAHAYDELGNIIMPQSGRSELNTFQNPKFLSITPEQQWLRADGQDLLYVEIKVLDNHSNLVEDAEEVLFVEVSGAGTLLALDSGNPIDHTPYKYPYGKTFGGKLIAIIQAQKFSGEVQIKVSYNNELPSAIRKAPVLQTVKDYARTHSMLLAYKLPQHFYLQQGEALTLPSQVELIDRSGSLHLVGLRWEKLAYVYAKAQRLGQFSVLTTCEFEGIKYAAQSYINVLPNTLYIQKDARSVLCDRRPFLAKCLELDWGEFSKPAQVVGLPKISVPVLWDQLSIDDFRDPGKKLVFGEAQLGKLRLPAETEVTIYEAEYHLGQNVADFATVDISNDNRSLTFNFATAQQLCAIRVPNKIEATSLDIAEMLEIYWSLSGKEEGSWNSIEIVKKIKELSQKQNGKTKDHIGFMFQTFHFKPVPVIAFKIVFTSEIQANLLEETANSVELILAEYT